MIGENGMTFKFQLSVDEFYWNTGTLVLFVYCL